MTGAPPVRGVGLRALEWLCAHQGQRARDAEELARAGEVGLVCGVVRREAPAGSRRALLAREALDGAWHGALDGGRALEAARWREPLSPVPFETYVPFRELGYRAPRLERLIGLEHRLGGWAALEVPPVRRLGLSALERRYGVTPSVPLPEAAARTWLARTPEPWTAGEETGRDAARTVFHLTDWGERPRGLPDAVAEYLALWLPAWLDGWAERGRWERLGELLAVAACLPGPVADGAAWAAFAAAQAPDGAVPPSRAAGGGGASGVHHTTLMAVLASALARSGAPAGA